jgi:hypothetical protein
MLHKDYEAGVQLQKKKSSGCDPQGASHQDEMIGRKRQS